MNNGVDKRYWGCKCSYGYIHSIENSRCEKCGAEEILMPPPKKGEVFEELGFKRGVVVIDNDEEFKEMVDNRRKFYIAKRYSCYSAGEYICFINNNKVIEKTITSVNKDYRINDKNNGCELVILSLSNSEF